jgi:hypothetical protein
MTTLLAVRGFLETAAWTTIELLSTAPAKAIVR